MNVLLETHVDRNIGDDLVLDLLVRHYPAVTFWAYGCDDLGFDTLTPYRNWGNFYLIGRSVWEELLDDFDAYLGLGGALWREDQKDALLIGDCTTRRMRELGRPSLLVASSIGPVSTPEGEAQVVELLERMDDLTLRDQVSFDWISQRSQVVKARRASAPVFLYPVPSTRRRPGLVGISVCSAHTTPDGSDPYCASLARLVDQLLSAGLRVRLFGFDSWAGGDAATIARIVEHLPAGLAPGAVEQCLYSGDIAGFLAAFGECEHVFAAHTHALLLALRFGIPFTPCTCSRETAVLLSDLKYRGPQLECSSLAAGLEEAAAHIRGKRVEYDQVSLVTMKVRAERNFTRADELLRGQASPLRPVVQRLIRRCEASGQAHEELDALKNSLSWRITRPLRWLARKGRST